MFDESMNKKQLEVRAGDRVMVKKRKGTVIQVYKGSISTFIDGVWIEEKGTDFTEVRVLFDDDVNPQFVCGEFLIMKGEQK